MSGRVVGEEAGNQRRERKNQESEGRRKAGTPRATVLADTVLLSPKPSRQKWKLLSIICSQLILQFVDDAKQWSLPKTKSLEQASPGHPVKSLESKLVVGWPLVTPRLILPTHGTQKCFILCPESDHLTLCCTKMQAKLDDIHAACQFKILWLGAQQL